MSHEYHKKIAEYEESVRAIMQKRQEILERKTPLTMEEVDYFFNSTQQIDQLFECQSMLLPMVEDQKTVSRWDSPADKLLQCMAEPVRK